MKKMIGWIWMIGVAAASAQQWNAPVTVSAEGDVASVSCAVVLNPTTAVVAYTDHREPVKKGKAVLCKISGNVVERISEIPFDSDKNISGASSLAMARLSDDRFVLCYQDSSPLGKVLVGKVADGKIQWNSESVFSGPNKAEFYDVAALSPEKLIFAYHGASNKRGFVVAAELMEDTPVFGTAVEINPAGPGSQYINQFNSLLALDGSRFVLAWSDATLGGQGFARMGTVNGTQITLGPAAQHSTANAPYPAMAALGTDRFALAYRDGSQGGKPSAVVGTLNGTAIQFGATQTVPTDGVGDCVTVAPLKDSVFAVAYRNNTVGRQSALHLCKASANGLQITPKYAVDRGASFQHLEKLDDQRLLLTQVIPGSKVECLVFYLK